MGKSTRRQRRLGTQTTGRERPTKADRALYESLSSWQPDLGADSFAEHVLTPERLFPECRTTLRPKRAGLLGDLLITYDAYERWLVGRKQAPPLLRDPSGSWVRDRLPLYTDQLIREQVEEVHHATDAIHRLQDELEPLRKKQVEDPLARQVLLLVAETYTTLLPVTRDPRRLLHLLKVSNRVRGGNRNSSLTRGRRRDIRLAPYQERANAIWRADPSFSKLAMTKRLAAEETGLDAEARRLLQGWLYDNLVKPTAR